MQTALQPADCACQGTLHGRAQNSSIQPIGVVLWTPRERALECYEYRVATGPCAIIIAQVRPRPDIKLPNICQADLVADRKRSGRQDVTPIRIAGLTEIKPDPHPADGA